MTYRFAHSAFKRLFTGLLVITAVTVLCVSFTASSNQTFRSKHGLNIARDPLDFPIRLQYRLVYPLNEPMVYQYPNLTASEIAPNASRESLKPKRHGHLTASRSFKKKAHLFHPIILKAADRHEVDPALVKAIIMAESGYNPKAISKRGAMGLMQLMPNTAKSLGVEDIFNPEHNINGGVRYFKNLVTRYDGDVRLALAAYNAGSRKVNQYKGVPPFKTTRFYIQKVLTYYEYFKSRMERA